MLLWVILFLLIVAISFVLAFLSMRDYQETPQSSKEEYGLFLIRKIENFNAQTLDFIQRFILEKDLIVSIERLFKGKQAALTIYGPKKILEQLAGNLNLLELEDYALDINWENALVWEVGVKNAQKVNPGNLNNIFQNFPPLAEEDQFFWQVILCAKKGGKDLSFQTQIRAAVSSNNPARKKDLAHLLQTFSLGDLVKVPKPFSQEQITNFYKLRSLGKDSSGPVLRSEGVMSLLKIS